MGTHSANSIHEYARSVVSGRVPAGRWLRAACQRHLDDLERSAAQAAAHAKKARRGTSRKVKGNNAAAPADFPYYFCEKRALRAIRFIENLTHVKGRWAARHQKLLLSPWQLWLVGSLFGWLCEGEDGSRNGDEKRRFREVYWEIARKNGKSVLAAAIGLYCMVEDGEHGAEVYSGATTEKQAWEIFRPARLMAKNNDAFLEYYDVGIHAKTLLREEDYSRFEPLIGKPGDGASPSCALIDEFHEHDTTDLYDTMATGMGSREQPILLVVTTAGVNIAGPCYEKRLEVQRMLTGTVPSPRLFGVIYTIDQDDDWKNPLVWPKANPNIDISVARDYLESQVAQAVRQPSKQSIIKCKHFNVWTGAKQQWINMEEWARAADPDLDEASFQRCLRFDGVDIATRVDICGRVSVYIKPREGDKLNEYFAFPKFYLPEGALTKAKNAQIYRGWSDSGVITIHDGEEVEISQIESELLASAGQGLLKEFGYDPWQATQLAQDLRKQGVETVEFRQTAPNYTPAMRELEAALASGRFHHNGNPCLTWMANNVVARADAKEQLFPRKELPDNKIDGIIALLIAMARAVAPREDAPKEPQIYFSSGTAQRQEQGRRSA